MSERVQVQKNSSTPSQAAPSPQLQQRPFTDERYHPVASATTISADSPTQQQKIARSSFNLMNIPIFAPTSGANIQNEGGIQRQEASEQENETNLQHNSDGLIQAKCNQCEAEEKEQNVMTLLLMDIDRYGC